MGNIISLFFTNFGLVMLVIAILFILIESIYKRKFTAEIIYRWVALFGLGITGFYSFIMHAFFPEVAASTIGWANSPFQFEVAVANLGFSLIGFISFFAGFGFRVATVIGNTAWLWGDAVGHIYQMIKFNNFAVGNAGSWFWLDILVPLILIICIAIMSKRTSRS